MGLLPRLGTVQLAAGWLIRDPIAELGGINLYGYILNNPVNFLDLFGMSDLGRLIGAMKTNSIMYIRKSFLLAIFAILSGCMLLPMSIENRDAGDRYMNALNKDERVQELLRNQPRSFLRGGFDGYGIGIIHTGKVLGVRANGEVIKDDHLTDAQVEVLGAIAVDIARKMHFPKRIVITDNDLRGQHGRTRVFYP